MMPLPAEPCKKRVSSFRRQSLKRSDNKPIEMNDAVGLGPQADPPGRTNCAVGRGQYDLAVIPDSKLIPVCKQHEAVPFSRDDMDVCGRELPGFSVHHAMKADVVLDRARSGHVVVIGVDKANHHAGCPTNAPGNRLEPGRDLDVCLVDPFVDREGKAIADSFLAELRKSLAVPCILIDNHLPIARSALAGESKLEIGNGVAGSHVCKRDGLVRRRGGISPCPPIHRKTNGAPSSSTVENAVARPRARTKVWNVSASATSRLPAPSARAIADETPPPIPLAAVCWMSITKGNASDTPASASGPRWPRNSPSNVIMPAMARRFRMFGGDRRSSVDRTGPSSSSFVRAATGRTTVLGDEKDNPDIELLRSFTCGPSPNARLEQHLDGSVFKNRAAALRPG